MQYFLAIDLGASSGRHIVGWQEGGAMKTQEVYRFANQCKRDNGHLTWDIAALENEVKSGIKAAFEKFGSLVSLSIDSWGVDYVLMRGSEPVLPCYAYRDNRTKSIIDEVHRLTPFEEMYSHTGCQFQTFTSVYQLYADKKAGRLDGVTDFLMIPEYLMYRLCGVKGRAYAHGTTTGLVNAQTSEFDYELIDRIGLPRNIFPALSPAGTALGPLLPEVAAEVGGSCIAILGPGHDTACAVEAIPMPDDSLYLSSGTWSLLGVKTPKPVTTPESLAANCSNEGGVGYNRHQKDIMGLWLVQSLRKELCPDKSFDQIALEITKNDCDTIIDANDQSLLSPESMKQAFDALSGGALREESDYFRCAYRSLAVCYRDGISALERSTGKIYDKLYIVGGGAKDSLLNRFTEETTGKTVVALPIEATSLGNLLIQSRAAEKQ